MFNFQTLVCTLLLFPALLSGQKTNAIQAEEMKNLAGVYSGELMYRDYTSDKNVSMPLVANCHLAKNRLVLDFILNEWGKTYNQQYDFRFDGAVVRASGQWAVLEKNFDTGKGTFRFVMTKNGRDGNDNKPCLFRITFDADPEHIVVSKEVRFDGTDLFFLRNEYRLDRVKVRQEGGKVSN